MSRNFPDWIEAYKSYAADKVCPESYILWSGLSLIAAALERKVWCVDGGKLARPNLFVLLVGPPGGGKSITIGKARPIYQMLRDKVKGPQREFKILEGLATQAGTCEMMETLNKEADGSKYSSIYCVGPEGSDSFLKNHADDFRSTACAMYDCENLYEKRLKTKTYFIENPVMNMLVGATPDFLKTVVDQSSVLGGLASRFTYVVDETDIPEQSDLDKDGVGLNHELITKLTDDLVSIYNLRGRFRFSKEALALHDEWWTSYRNELKSVDSDRMRSLLVRKPLMLKKASMLYSASSSDSLTISEQDMQRAITAVDHTTKDLAGIISSAMMGNRMSQDGINQFILQALKNNKGNLSVKVIKQKFITFGGDVSKYEATVKMLIEAGMIDFESGGNKIKLLVDPDRHL